MAQSCPTLCNCMDRSPPGSSVHGDSPGKNTGAGCYALFQGIFPTQGSNLHLLCLLHWQGGSLPLVPLGSPSFDRHLSYLGSASCFSHSELLSRLILGSVCSLMAASSRVPSGLTSSPSVVAAIAKGHDTLCPLIWQEILHFSQAPQ